MAVARKLFLVLVMLAGLCLLAYPHVASWLFDRAAVEVVDSYEETVSNSSQQDIDDAWAKAVEYNENLYGNPVHDPFVEGSGMVMADNYYQVLDVDGTGMMGHVSIPKISVELPVYHGTSEKTLARGVGHLEGSSMPTGGIGTHTVLTGHSGLVNAKLFTDLEELQEGDRFFVKILDKTLAYEVDRLLVVEPEDTSELRRVEGQDYCTLVTCTPYGVNSHRLLVRGHRVEYTPEDEQAQADKAGAGGLTREQIVLLASAIGGALGVILVALFIRHRRRRADDDGAPDDAAVMAAIAAAARADLEAREGPPGTPESPGGVLRESGDGRFSGTRLGDGVAAPDMPNAPAASDAPGAPGSRAVSTPDDEAKAALRAAAVAIARRRAAARDGAVARGMHGESDDEAGGRA